MKWFSNSEMERSWLIQRLLRPKYTNSNGLNLDSMAFGGGLKNGGLTDEAMNIIKDVWSFDYMGAAEFEFGKVPEALCNMWKNKRKLKALSINVVTNKVTENGFHIDKDLYSDPVVATVYILCRKSHIDEVIKRVTSWALDGYSKDRSRDTKESILLNQTLRRKSNQIKHWNDYVGWLELDNGFMFFSDKETWEKTCKIFGVKII